MQEKINVRFLVCLLGGCLLLGTGWFLLHRFQVRRHATTLLDYADLAESQERFDRASRFVQLYVDLVPTDTAARARYGLLLDRLAQSAGARYVAMQVFDQVLLREPDRHDIRRRYISLAIELGLFDDALQHLEILRKAQLSDGELEQQLGLCLEARGAYAEARAQYQLAITHTPGHIETYSRYARLLRDRLKQERDAENLLDKMVEVNRQSFQAYLARARFRLEADPSDEALLRAKKDIDEALRLAPDEVEVLLTAADVAQKQPEGFEQARTYLQHQLDRYPKDPRTYTALAELESRMGRLDEAVQYLRRGLNELPHHSDMLWNLANLLIQKGELGEAQELIAELGKMKLPAAQIEYLNAAIVFKRGNCQEASKRLEAVRPLLLHSRELTIQCDYLLGQCYEKQEDFDRQLLVYRRILRMDASQASARYGVASALYNLGKIKEALEECQRMMDLPKPPAVGWTLQARLMIAQNLRLPSDQRTWERVHKILDNAARALPESTDVPILRAEVLVSQQEISKARTVLEEARDRHPQKTEFWIALAELATHEGKPEVALGIIDDAERKCGDGIGLRLARLRLLLSRSRTGSVPALAKLEEGLERFVPTDRASLLNGLGAAYRQLGQLDQAKRLWNEAARLQPEHLPIRLRLFDLAADSNDQNGMEEALAAIQRLEGTGGPLGHFDKARLLIWRAKQGDKALLSAAREELGMVTKRRSGWSRVPLCLGEIDDLEGNRERAIENYLRALELGDRQPELVRRVVQLLYERRRYSDADLVIQRLAEQSPLFSDLQQVAAEVSLQVRDYPRTLELAKKAVPADSKDYRDYLWLGQVRWVAAQQAGLEPTLRHAAEAEAETALRRAVDLADTVPDTWVALVQHLARTGQTKEAETAIRQAQGKLTKEQAALALAQCYASMNRLQEAKECFGLALQAKPDDVTVLRNCADFYFRIGELQQAETCLRKLSANAGLEPAVVAWAQRTLAVVLAASGNYRRSREALMILERMEGPNPEKRPSSESIENQRAKAVILTLQPSLQEQRKAIAILEKLHSVQALSSEDQFLLVQLYERVGDLNKARERMLLLLGSAQENPRYVAHFVRSLLMRGETGEVERIEAEHWLAILEKQQPQAFTTMELKARLLKAQGKGAEVGPLFKAPDQISEPEMVLRIAGLLEELEQSAAAEWYRRYVSVSKQPEAILLLAKYLGRHKRLTEALELCERAWQTCPAEAVGEAYVAVLRTAPVSDDQYLRFERRLQQAIQQNPKAMGLLVCLASLHDLRGRYQEAENLYFQIIDRDQSNVVALNNLAWLLALNDGKGQQAYLLINRAVEILGPIPELLDTRAVACLAMGNSKQALLDLKEAIRPTVAKSVLASVNFHLVQAYQMDGDQREATNAWRAAKKTGLEASAIHPLEVKKYREMIAQLDRR